LALVNHSPRPEDIIKSSRTILAEYLACGIDPEKATIYVQSDVKEVLELYLYLNMNAYLGEMERCTTFKEKARKQPDNVNAGLLTYPTLMAADILIHKAIKVPVGKDQEQNMKWPANLPAASTPCMKRIVSRTSIVLSCQSGGEDTGLDGSGKMGKSEGNCIYLMDDAETIRKKVMKAVTDSGPTTPNSEKPEVIRNLFTFLDIVSTKDTYQYFDEKWNDCSIRYGDLKKQLAEDIAKFNAPIRERINEYSQDIEFLDRVAKIGAEKAGESASKTLEEVRKTIGFRI
jgi:tryptophanyl-tRNA synthetase